MKLTPKQRAELMERGEIVSIKGRLYISLEALEAHEEEAEHPKAPTVTKDAK